MKGKLTSSMVEVTTKITMQEARRLPRKTRTVRKMTTRLVTMFCQSSWPMILSVSQLEYLIARGNTAVQSIYYSICGKG